MEEQTDKVFIRNISIVLVLLIAFTFAIIFLARDVGFKDEEEIPSRTATIEERIRPVGDVYTGEAGAAAIEAAAATTVTEMKVAFDGSLDAEMLYGSVCGVCHATGAAGAPMPGSPLMAERATKGVDMLTQNAINGINAMPARGGRTDLSDEQIRVIVEYMVQ